MSGNAITIDGKTVAFEPGQTVMQAAEAAGVYIPHLCHHPEFSPHGSCKLCTVKVNGRNGASCTIRAQPGMVVENNTVELNDGRRALTQMLFVEGNHFCPFCERSGNCQLQAVAYFLQMTSPHFEHFYPAREVDASHPEVLLDRNRCILCELCVRASRDADGKNVFGIAGRGIQVHLVVNSHSGRLGDTGLAASDKAVQVCPVGAIIRKGTAFRVPVGKRLYDKAPISEVGTHVAGEAHGKT